MRYAVIRNTVLTASINTCISGLTLEENAPIRFSYTMLTMSEIDETGRID